VLMGVGIYLSLSDSGELHNHCHDNFCIESFANYFTYPLTGSNPPLTTEAMQASYLSRQDVVEFVDYGTNQLIDALLNTPITQPISLPASTVDTWRRSTSV